VCVCVYIYIYIYSYKHPYRCLYVYYFPSVLTHFPVSFACLNLRPTRPPVTCFLNNKTAKLSPSTYLHFTSFQLTRSVLRYIFCSPNYNNSRSQWPRGLTRGPTTAHLLGLWVLIPPGAWMFASC